MRTALAVLMLFSVAVAVALLVGNNQGMVTLFWPPHRVDLSVNLLLLLLLAVFVTFHVALRALSALFALPQQAMRWRMQQRERALFTALLDTLLHLIAGRFIRARKSALTALAQEEVLAESANALVDGGRLKSMAHLLAAESAHSLLDKEGRALHFQQALQVSGQRDAVEVREGVQLRAARWAMDDRDATTALKWLDEMPQGASRRTAALRLRLKAARMAGQTANALETARLLAKHRAFSDAVGASIVRGLTQELIANSRDPAQLLKVWQEIDVKERADVEIAVYAVHHLLSLRGDAALSRQWLLPVWEKMVEDPAVMAQAHRIAIIECIEQGFAAPNSGPDAAWLQRIESAQFRHPGDPMLQYAAGIACKHLQLWGKAQQLLNHSLPKLRGGRLERSAWMALASLAEQRGDNAVATQYWRTAATITSAMPEARFPQTAA